MGTLRIALLSFFAFILLSMSALGQDGNSVGVLSQNHDPAAAQLNVPVPGPVSFDQVLDKVVEREHFFTAQMRHFHPLAEPNFKNPKTVSDLDSGPANLKYFRGRSVLT